MYITKELLKHNAMLEKCRRNFWFYCKTVASDFYKDDREYLKTLANELQSFVNSDDDVLFVNMPPRHGKSRTVGLFVQWLFGNDRTLKIMTGSYNETLSTVFSKSVRNAISMLPSDKLVYSDIFPNTKIKRGDSAANLWSLEGNSTNNYLATSPTGTATGFGADCFIGKTIVYTDKGLMTIEDIFNDSSIIRVLSYDHENGIIRYNVIQAKRKKVSNELIKITTHDGRTIVSTRNHRYYTKEHGYIEANKLTVGETFITSTPIKVRCMWKIKRWARKNVSRMLRQIKNGEDRKDLRLLWNEVSSFEIRARKSHIKRLHKKLLHQDMFLQGERKKTTNKKMPYMWETTSTNKEILFGRLQNNICEATQKTKTYSMRNVQNGIYAKKQYDEILLNEMQKQISLKINDRKRELKIRTRQMLHKGISNIETYYQTKRQLHLPKLWKKRNASAIKKIWNDNEFAYSSHRSQQTKQRRNEFNNIVSRMSYGIAQNQKIAKIELIQDSEWVYDIQVANDHNFFANGILVHNCIICDDVLKSAYEAYNDTILESHYEWFANTMLSRLEGKRKIIMVMTRWSSKDLCGRCEVELAKAGMKIKKITYKAFDGENMLCDDILDYKAYKALQATLNPDILEANYNQQPIDMKNCLYSEFKTYDELPSDIYKIGSYTDTADTGKDYLASIIYGVSRSTRLIYVLDIIYTQDGMEKTEPLVAQSFIDFKVKISYIESNNGGMGFSRNVGLILRNAKHHTTTIRTFHQTANKQARILSNATAVQNNILFPSGWHIRYTQAYKDLMSYQRIGKNSHDDIQDCLTGVYEKEMKGHAGWSV